jgi:hypothetical protein
VSGITTGKEKPVFSDPEAYLSRYLGSLEMGEHRTQIGRADSLVDFMNLGRGMVDESFCERLRYLSLR